MTAGAAGASAFFTDMESYGSDTVKTGELLFSFPDDSKPEGGKDKDFSIVADLGDHGDRLTPYKEGEDIEISFRAYLGGDVPAIVVPRLEVITGGIGENDFVVREEVCKGLEFMGVAFDAQKNNGLRGVDAILSKPESKVKVAVVSTDEELVIATDTMNIVKGR